MCNKIEKNYLKVHSEPEDYLVKVFNKIQRKIRFYLRYMDFKPLAVPHLDSTVCILRTCNL